MSYFWETGVYALCFGTALAALYVAPDLLRAWRKERDGTGYPGTRPQLRKPPPPPVPGREDKP